MILNFKLRTYDRRSPNSDRRHFEDIYGAYFCEERRTKERRSTKDRRVISISLIQRHNRKETSR